MVATDLYLRGASSLIFALSGGMKSTGAMNAQLGAFGYPTWFAQVLGVGEVALAAANVGPELAPLLGFSAAPFVAGNVWVQRAFALIMGGATAQHLVAGDNGFVVPLVLLALSAAVPALRGDAASPAEAAGVAAALAAAGYGVVHLIARKPAAAPAASKTK